MHVVLKFKALAILLNIASFFFVFSFFSCQSKIRKSDDSIGEKCVFPNIINWSKFGKDTICSGMLNKDLKIVIYNKSNHCNDCSLKLGLWKNIINQVDTSRISFIFFINAINNEEEINSLLKIYEFDYPIIIDKKNEFFELNKLLKINDSDCFLLDRNNIVLLRGSPLYSQEILDKYSNMIFQ